MWTLAYNGIEQTLASWGICDDFAISNTNKGKGTATFRTIEGFDPAAGPQFAYGQPAVLWRDRTAIGVGGSVAFAGYWDDPEQSISGSKQSIKYKLHNVWWLFERSQFHQARSQFTGWDSAHQSIIGVNVATGGFGYLTGDVLTLTGGVGTAATVTVLLATEGVIQACAVRTRMATRSPTTVSSAWACVTRSTPPAPPPRTASRSSRSVYASKAPAWPQSP